MGGLQRVRILDGHYFTMRPRQCSLGCQRKGEMHQFKRCGFCRSWFKHFGGLYDHFAPGARVEGPAS